MTEKLLDEDFLLDVEQSTKSTVRQQYLQELHQLKKEIASLERQVEDQTNMEVEETAQNIL